MWRRFQPPLALAGLALLALIAVLAVLQYRWLGQFSEAERAQRRATLAAGVQEFAQDFDREINRAYLLFQGEPRGLLANDAPSPAGGPPPDNGFAASNEAQLAERFATRYDHWQANSRFPRLMKDLYAFSQNDEGVVSLRRFDPVKRTLEPVGWPSSMAGWREHLAAGNGRERTQTGEAIVVRRIPRAIWEDVPALVVPAPMVFTATIPSGADADRRNGMTATFTRALGMPMSFGYSILVIDRDYVARELLPALAQRHFSQHPDTGATIGALAFKVAVLSRQGPIFQSSPAFTPAFDAQADATADLFQLRTHDFTTLVSEVRRLTAVGATAPPAAGGMAGRLNLGENRPLSIFIQQTGAAGGERAGPTATRVTSSGSAPLWRLVVSHPSGSLENAVSAGRRRNLVVSFSILGILGASMGLLVLATRRAQRLARQQMEFVATVSHELRTPLAVIRSAAENLADGVVHDEDRIRRYGEVMRSEGRRLTEMVEQILEFAGIQSGRRGFVLRPVAVDPLVRDILSSSAAIIEGAGLSVEVEIPENLPPVLGDEHALRRVFQNLIDNAVKYGASGGSVRVSARADGPNVFVTVADRGIGIAPVDQARIFEPFYRAADVVAAQMQGAGLGLSLVQRIVTAHGGQVSVNSTPRDGSEFIVRLPIAAGLPAEAERSNLPADQSPPRLRRSSGHAINRL